MKPVVAFDNFPSFGDAGARTAPGEAKYAAGFVPADTFPAEWANYFMHGATKGISDLNSATRSIWLELQNVLTNYNITPSADPAQSSQILEALTKLKSEAALAAHPVGSLYWTSVNQNPATTFGGGTWTQIKDKFILAAGDTYTNGATGGAATVTLTTAQMPSHTHTFTGTEVTSGDSSTANTGSESSHTHGYSHTHKYTHSHKYTPKGTVNSGGSWSFTMRKDAGGNPMWSLSNLSGSSVSADMSPLSAGGSGTNTFKVTHGGHGHTFTGTEASTTSQTANVTTDQSATTTGAGSSHSHSMAHTHKVTASGSNGYTGGPSGASAGQAEAHNNMPPYIVKYCWERVS